MEKLNNIIISGQDIIDTIDELQHTDKYIITEKQMDAIYYFASDLIGISIDKLMESLSQS